jgi:Starch-binding associating with outer membrane
MKRNKIIYTLLAVALLINLGACKKEKFDINSNPDAVTDDSVTPTVILPAALQTTSTIIAANYWVLSWWMGHGARSGSFQSLNEEETYAFTNDFHAGDGWNALYANANNYNTMINRAKAIGAGTYEAIGRIMKSHNMAMLVDIYNNIPYSEAFKGTVAITPKYDKGVDVYNAIFADLDAAIALLNDPAANELAKNPEIATSDFVYAGNVVRWRQFANTLRLRMLVHLHNGVNTTTVAPGVNIATQVSKITADGFLGAGQSAHLNPGFSAAKPQPYFRVYNTNESGTGSQRDFLRASKYAIDYYKYDGDPRIDRFYVSPNGTTNGHTGIPFGTPSGGAAPQGSALSTVRGPGLSPNGAASRAWILTSVESLFLQAEARQRGVLTSGPSAAALLTSAINESFVWLGLTTTDASNYIAFNAGFPDVDITAAGGGVYTILSQKWFALNSIAPYEIWSDFRRSDIVYGAAAGFQAGPTLSVDPNRTATSIPRRWFYPQNEYNYNSANVTAEGTINVFTGKIFWDLN